VQRVEQLRLEEAQRRAEQERLQLEREAAERRKREEEQARQQELARQEQLRRERAAEERAAKERAAAEARAAHQALVDDFKARISAKVRTRVVMPPNISGNPEAVYEVILLPGGDVLRATLKKSSGVPAYDTAVARAINAAAPLPVPEDPKLFQQYFRKFNLSFRPKE
jgi:colicin import membrane protein